MISRVKFKIDNSNFRPQNILFFIAMNQSIVSKRHRRRMTYNNNPDDNDNGDENDGDDEYNTYLHCGQVKYQWKKKSIILEAVISTMNVSMRITT